MNIPPRVRRVRMATAAIRTTIKTATTETTPAIIAVGDDDDEGNEETGALSETSAVSNSKQ
jgi:hypothetical protein